MRRHSHVNPHSIFPITFLTTAALLFSMQLFSQNLTINNAGQTGTSGSNWSTSGTNPVTITFTGTANINISVIQGYLNSGTGVVIQGGSGSDDIILEDNISKSSGADATLTMRAYGDIIFQSRGISSTSNKLNLVLVSDYESAAGGGVYLNGASPIQINTNGGHLWIGGNGFVSAFADVTWNGLTVGAGFGVSGDGASIWEGVNILGTSINTGGGNLYIAGKNARYVDSNARFGVLIHQNSTLSTGAGDIEILGELAPRSPGYIPLLYCVDVANSTIQTTTGAITITGREGAADISFNAGGFGVRILNGTVQSTGSTGGNITINGTTGADSGGNAIRNGVFLTADGANAVTNIASVAGNIQITGTDNGVNSNANAGGLRFYTRQPVDANATNPTIYVTSSTGNITLNGDSPNNTNIAGKGIYLDGSSWGRVFLGSDGSNDHSGNLTLNGRSIKSQQFAGGYLSATGSGQLTLQPTGNSFVEGTSTLHTFDLTSQWNLGSNHSSVTIGKAASTNVLTISTPVTAAGQITLYGGRVVLNANLTSSATGDIFIQGNNNENSCIYIGGATITKSGGSGTLTLKAKGRVTQGGTITTSGSGVLNAVLWADYDASFDAGVSGTGTISTNGGHVWIGGTATANGSATWNGLTVGNGPSRGGYNCNAIDLTGNITTSGGDIYIWAGPGACGTPFNGIAGTQTFSSGSGDITVKSNRYSGVLTINSTGHLTIEPNSNAWENVGGQMDLQGTLSNGNFTGSGDAAWLKVNSVSNLTELTIGHPTTTSGVAFYTPWNIAGPINIYAAGISIGGALTATGSDINLHATGAVTQGSGGALNANGLALHGTGTFTLTNASNNVTTIAGGDGTTPLGSLSYTNASAVTIGTVNPTGITSSGNVLIETVTGDINLTEPITTTSTANSTTGYTGAIVLNAGKNSAIGTSSGGDIKVSGNGDVTAASGIIKLYSGNEANSTGLNTLVGNSANVRYNVDETTTTFSPVLTGNSKNALYRFETGGGDLNIVLGGGDAEGTSWSYSGGVLSTLTTPANVNVADVLEKMAIADLSIEANNINVQTPINVPTSGAGLSLKARNLLSIEFDITTNDGNLLLQSRTSASGLRLASGITAITLDVGAGDITLEADQIAFDGNLTASSTRTTSITSTGVLTMRPFSNAFTSAMMNGMDGSTGNFVDWSGALSGSTWVITTAQYSGADFRGLRINNFANLSGFVLGKVGGTNNITLNSGIAIAGSIEVHGGSITYVAGLSTTNAGASILLSATGDIVNYGATAKTFQTNNGNITLNADSDANSTGVMTMDYTTFIAGSGDITFRMHSFSWCTSGPSCIPTISGTTGGFVIESNAANFGVAFYTRWISFPSTLSSFRIGKTDNNKSIIHDTNVLNVAGPVEFNCLDIDLGIALNTTAPGGNVLIRALGFINQTGAASTITTQGGSVILWSDADGTQGNDYIYFRANVTTNGGHIYAGGGSATETLNGLTVPTGYAHKNTSWDFGLMVWNSIINSAGGDIRMKGRQSGVNGNAAGLIVINSTIQSGTGKLELYGSRVGDPWASAGLWLGTGIGSGTATGNVTLSSTSGNIYLEGLSSSTDTYAWNHGLALVTTGTDAITISSTSGNITMSGDASGNPATFGESVGLVMQNGSGGPIAINTDGGEILLSGKSGNTGDDFGASFRAGNAAGRISIGDSNSGDVTLRMGSLSTSPQTVLGVVSIQSAGSYVIEGIDGNAFNTAINLTDEYGFGSNGTSLRIGSTNNNQNLTIGATANIGGPISVYGNNLTLNGPLTATANDIDLHATGAVTQGSGGALNANGLALHGPGTFTLTNTSNSVTAIAGGDGTTALGSLSYTDANAVTIGTVNPTGITSSGNVLIETVTGNINLNEDITTTSTNANAIILNAGKSKSPGDGTGGDIIVSGTPALTTGSGGIVKLYSGSETNSTGLSALATTASNIIDNVDETTTFSPTLSADNTYALYRYGFGSLGNLTIVNTGGHAQGTTWDISGGILRPTGTAAANVNASVVEGFLAAGDLTIHAGWVIFNANVNSTTANNFKVWANTHISNNSATTITTQGGDVLFATNINDATDGESTTNGYIRFGNGLTITTNGGDITLGGGNTSGTDYALGTSNEAIVEGVRVDGVLQLNSGGGDILIRGKSYARSVRWEWGAAGVGFFATTAAGNIQSGAGTITIDGYSQSWTSTYAAGIYINSAINIISANTTADAIQLIGTATGNGGEAWGIETEGVFTVMATGTGGGIALKTSNKNTSNNYDAVLRNVVNILAASGPIKLLGRQAVDGIANGILYFNNSVYIGSKAGTAVTSSSSDINIEFDRFSFNNFRPYMATTGAVSWLSASASFGAAVQTDWFRWNQNSHTMSGFTIGKPTNDKEVNHYTDAISVAGPITFYGVGIRFQADLSSTAGSDISLYASQWFDNTTNTRRTISTNGGNIRVWADNDANGTGTMSVDYITFNPGAGTTHLRSEGFSWSTSSAGVKPYINGTGNFIYESSDDAFDSGFATRWFNFDQDANGIGSITIGKPTNNLDIDINSDGTTLSAAGPLIAYGRNINSTAPVTLNVGGLLYKAITGISVTANITTAGSDVVLWSDSDANGTDNVAGGTIYVASNILTSGGDIVMAGGADDGNGLPGGYASGAYPLSSTQSGLQLNGAVLNAGSGDVRLRGKGTGNNSDFQEGMWIRNTAITAANITVDAIGSFRGASSSNWGLEISNSTLTGSGAINLTGKGGRAGTTNSDTNQHGVHIRDNSLVQATGTGTITINGTGGSGALTAIPLTNNSRGIFLSQSNAALTTAGGTITLNGTSAYSGRGQAVFIAAPITGTGNIVINALPSVEGTTGLNGDVAINAAITATNANVLINSPGAVTQNGAISASKLGLEGTGTFTLTNTSNNVATIAGGSSATRLGRLSYVDASGGLTIGTVNPTGIYSTGAVIIETLTGNITLEEDINTLSDSTSAVVLNAGKSKAIGDVTGGDIIVSGSPTITYGSGGIARLFSGRQSNSTGLTTLAGGSANVREGVDETTTTFSPVLSANNTYALYRFSLNNLSDLTIVNSGGDAANTTWLYEDGMVRPTSSAAANVNASDIVSYLALGDVEVRAGNITINGNITSSANNSLTFKTNGSVLHQASRTISTSGDVVYWSDLDGSGGGRIELLGSVSTNGGDIYAGGGSASETIGSLTVPTGYATGITNTHDGIRIRGGTINSGGGDIRMKGRSNTVNGVNAGIMVANASIQSGAGNLSLYGIREGDPDRSAGLWIGSDMVLPAPTGNVSITSTSGNITLEGVSQASNTYSWNHGLALVSYSGDDINISSTLGNISLTGNSSNAAAFTGEAVGLVFQSNNTSGLISVTTDGGSITLTGTGANNSQDYGLSLKAANAAGNITIGDSNSGDVTLNFDYLARDVQTVLGVTSINSGGAISLQPVGADWGANLTIFDELSFGSNATSLTIGPATSTRVLAMSAVANIAGPVTMYGGRVELYANLTSSADGDIYIQGNNNENNCILVSGATITKSGGSGTLTLKAIGRVNQGGTITTSGSGVMNAVLWADYDASFDAGVSGTGTISTNGGHVWIGGTATANGSATWNGLTVGNGPSRGGYNSNALDLTGNITTSNGDIYIWAGQGLSGDIAGTQTFNSGSGDITVKSNRYSGVLTINSTGHLTIEPNTNAWDGVEDQLNLEGTLSGGNFTGSGDAAWLIVNNVASLGGLTLGHPTSTTLIKTYTPWSIAGPITIYAPTIDIDANLIAANGNILLDADNGTLPTSANPGILLNNTVTIQTTGSGDITLIGQSGTGNDADGISMVDNSTVTINAAGNLTIEGYSNGSSSSARGVDINNDILTAAGAITIKGRSGVSSTYGVSMAGTASVTGEGVSIETFRDGADQISLGGTVSINGGSQLVELKTANLELPSTTTRTITTTGPVSIVPDADETSFATAINTQYLNIQNSSALTIGKNGNTANITIGRATTVAGPVTLYGGTLAINGALTATGDDINLHASVAATQTSALVADGLGLHGAVNYSLTNASNNVATLAGGDATTKLAGLTFLDASGGLTIGSVNPTGIYSTGPVLIETTTGDITLSEDITTDDATANAIVLNAGKSKAIGDATGGDVKISGMPVLTIGTGGIVKLFSGSRDNSTGLDDFVGGVAYVRNGVDETTSPFSPVLTAGNQYALYRAGCTVGTASANPTLCENEAISPIITFATTLVTGIGTPTGLPSGVTASFNSTTMEVEVSGTPTQPGVFNYQIPLVGACVATVAMGTITVKSAPVASITVEDESGLTDDDGTICDGGTAVLTASGGVTYDWGGSITTPTRVVMPTATTTYMVTVTASNGCTDTASETINVNAAPNPMITAFANPNCPTALSGTVTATVDLSWSYAWSNGQTTATATNLAEGLHVVTATDANGCTGTTSQVLTDIGMVINVSKTDVVCYGASTGSISLTLTAGSSTAPYTYLWSPNAGSATTTTVSLLPAGTYTVTVTESGSNSCEAVSTIEITQPAHPVLANMTVDETSGLIADDGIICIGDDVDLTVNATASMGRTIASYLWNDSASSTTSSINVTTAGAFTVTVTDDMGCTATVTSTVTVDPLNTVGTASTIPPMCFNELLTPNITHATTGATGIGFATGLPVGLSASWASNEITISGTPVERGTFNYSIPLSGGCGTFNATGMITVSATNTVSAASSSPTVCFNEAMPSVTFTTTGATGIGTPSNLPTGVTASWSGNTITVSGTPTQSGTFNYTIPLTGGCGTVNATGVMTVTASNTVTTQATVAVECINQAITPITFTTTGATGIGSATGLPAGVTANWASNTITLSGTPTVSGMFSFSIPLTGGCGMVTATGTVNIISVNTASSPSSNPSVCVNGALPAVTITTVGATGITNDGVSGANGLPAGVSATWASNTITITGTPTATGIFNYSIPLSGGCGLVTATGTVTVYNEPTPVITITNPNNATPTELCNENEVTLTVPGTMGNTYVWTISGTATGTISGGTTVTGTVSGGLVTLKFTPSSVGSLIFTYTETGIGDCTGSAMVTTNVNAISSILSSIDIDNPSNSTDINLCNLSAVTLTGASSAGAGTTYLWSVSGTGSGSFSTTTARSVTYTPSGVGSALISFTATETNGCVSTRTVSTQIYPAAPTVSLAIASNPNNATLANLCTGMADMTLEATGTVNAPPATYTWNKSGAGATSSFIDPTTGTFASPLSMLYNPGAAGMAEFSITLVDNNGCSTTSAPLNATVYPGVTTPGAIQIATAPIVTPPTTPITQLCTSGNYNLTLATASEIVGNGVGTIQSQWGQTTVIGTYVSGSTSAEMAVYRPQTATGSLTLTYTATNSNGGCSVSTSLGSLTVSTSTLSAAITPSNGKLCVGNALAINANQFGGVAPYTYLWVETTTGAPLGGFTATNTANSTFLLGMTPGTAEVSMRVTDASGCPAVSSSTIQIDPQVEVIIRKAGETAEATTADVCFGSSLALEAVATGGGLTSTENYTYNWILVDPLGSASSILNSATTNTAGVHAVTFTPPSTAVDGTTYRLRVYAEVNVFGRRDGCNDFSQDIVITVRKITSATLALATGASSEVCADGTTDMVLNVVRPSAGTHTYSFDYSINGSGTNTISGVSAGASITTLGLSALGTNTIAITGLVTDEGGCAVSATGSVSVNVVADPVVTLPADQTVCKDAVVELSPIVSGGIPGSEDYSWENNYNGTGTVPFGSEDTQTANTTLGNSEDLFRVTVQQGTASLHCISEPSPSSTVTVAADPTINVQPVDIIRCIGGNNPLTVTAVGGTPALNYQWLYSATSDFEDATNVGTDAASYIPESTTLGTAYYRVLVSATGLDCQTVSSTVAEVTVVPDPSITSDPVGFTLCIGGSAPLTVAAIDGTPSLTYQWESGASPTGSFSPIIGETSTSFTPLSGTASTTYYRVVASAAGSGCDAATSTAAEVIIVPDPIGPTIDVATPTTTATPVNVCVGQALTATFLAGTGGTGTCEDLYRYVVTNSQTLMAQTVTFTGGFGYTIEANETVEVQTLRECDGNGCDGAGESWNTIAAWTAIAPVVGNAVLSTATICQGGSSSLTATVTGGVGGYENIWQYSSDGITWTDIANGTPLGASYTGQGTTTLGVSGISEGGNYQYRLKVSKNGCTSVEGVSGTLTVIEVVSLANQQITICNETVVGSFLPAGFMLPSVGTTTWTWTMGTLPPGVTVAAGSSSGTGTSINTSFLNLNNFSREAVYTVVPTTTANALACAASPVTVTVTVNPTPVLTGINPNGPLTLCAGESRFVAAASITNNPRFTWSIIAGTATGITLNGQAVSVGAGSVMTDVDYVELEATGSGTLTLQVVAGDAAGCPPDGNPSSLIFTVASNPSSAVLVAPNNDLNPCSGTTKMYAVEGVMGRTYQWSLSSGGTFASAPTSSSVMVSWSAPAGSVHTLTLTESVGGCTSTTQFPVTIATQPTITTQPEAQTICTGGSFAAISVTASNLVSPQYQWYLNGAAISGANASSYTPVVSTVNTGTSSIVYNYYVVITNSGTTCASVQSNTVALTVVPGVLTEAGGNLTTCAGSPVMLSGATITHFGAPYTGTWTIAGGGVGSIQNANSVTGAVYVAPENAPDGTQVTLILTSDNPGMGCQTTSDTRIVTISNPTLGIGTPSFSVCLGSAVTLTGSLSGAWTNPVVAWIVTPGQGTFSDPNSLITTFTPSVLGAVTVRLTGTDEICDAKSVAITLTVGEGPEVAVTAPATVCEGADISVNASISGSVSTGIWTSSGSGSFASSTSVNTVYTPSIADVMAGTVTLTFTTIDPTGTCSPGSDAATVVFGQLPTPVIEMTNNNACAFSGTNITFTASGGTGVFSSNAPTGSFSSSGNMATLDISEACAGDFTVTYTVSEGACVASATVTATVQNCGVEVMGQLKFSDNQALGVANGLVTLREGTTVRDTMSSNATGHYTVDWSSGTSFTVSATKNRSWANGAGAGVTTADASRVLQHVGGLPANQLTSPYKRIAADVNADNQITGSDASLILQALTNNLVAQFRFTSRSWVFVPQAQVLTPATWNTYTTSITITDPCDLETANFIGVKIGDVTSPLANPGLGFTHQEESNLGWMVNDVVLNEGTEVVAEFRAMGIESLMAYQFALGFDTEKLAFLGVEQVSGSPIAPIFGTASDGVLRTAFASGQGRNLTSDTPVFRVRFRVVEGGGMLSQALEIDETAMEPEAYTTNDYQVGAVNLWFTTLTSVEALTKGGLILYQNRPNPFSEKTTIGYILPEQCEVRMRIYEASGRLIAEQKAWNAAGYNEMEFRFDRYEGAGVLYYELVTPMGSLTRKMVVSRKQ